MRVSEKESKDEDESAFETHRMEALRFCLDGIRVGRRPGIWVQMAKWAWLSVRLAGLYGLPWLPLPWFSTRAEPVSERLRLLLITVIVVCREGAASRGGGSLNGCLRLQRWLCGV
ncbi:hypothetical protein Ddc_10288 [Ditylenchus destructor]|nr:hypothetical protein Ddc_10288 [Ditylenchus destructor]